jgi:hypothetical protein
MMKRVKDILSAHPGEIIIDINALANCIMECFNCAQICDVCANACLSEENLGNLVQCIRLNFICSQICTVTGRILSRQSGRDLRLKRTQIESCLKACQACGDECKIHALHHEHCRLCAEACRRCEESCTALLNAVTITV